MKWKQCETNSARTKRFWSSHKYKQVEKELLDAMGTKVKT